MLTVILEAWSNDNFYARIKYEIKSFMKKIIISIIMVSVYGILALQNSLAQGAAYMSNLGQPSVGSGTVGSDSWLAVTFLTGYNADGYTLNSIQLAMTDASSNPSDFTAMIYNEANNPAAILPGSSLGTLSGSGNPLTAGIYTYTPETDIILSSHSYYFIVLTAGTTVAVGAYGLNEGASYATSSDGGGGGLIFSSNDGSSWRGNAFTYAQFAITATAIPEPSIPFLLLLGSGVLFYVRKRHSA